MTDAHVTPTAVSAGITVTSPSVRTGSAVQPVSITALANVVAPIYTSDIIAGVGGYFGEYGGHWALYSWADTNYYLDLALFNDDPTPAYNNSVLVDWQRMSYDISGSQLILNADLTFTNGATVSVITYMGVLASSSLLFYWQLDESITIAANATFVVAAGTFSLYIPVGA